jgi:hypothetical protein
VPEPRPDLRDQRGVLPRPGVRRAEDRQEVPRVQDPGRGLPPDGRMLQRSHLPPHFRQEDMSPVKRDNSMLTFKAVFVSLIPLLVEQKKKNSLAT